MEYVENAAVLKDFIDENISGKTDVDHLIEFIGRGLGTLIARLHSRHMIHGDLTTSNILFRNDSNEPSCSDQSEGDERNLFAIACFEYGKYYRGYAV